MSSTSPQLAINLLPQDPFLDSTLGRVMQWAMGAGRYIVIFTEIIVILSFAARFTLDRQVTDLNETLYDQIQQLEGMAADEAAFRLAQAQLAEIKKSQDVSNILEVFAVLNTVVPAEVILNTLNISQSSISLEATAQTQASFIQFVNNLQLTPQFNRISIGKVESSGSGQNGFSFSIQASTKEVPVVAVKKAPADATTPSSTDTENLLQ